MYICVYKVNGGLVAKLCLALLQPHGLFCDPARLLFPSPGDLPDPGIESAPPALQVDSLLTEPPGKPVHTHRYILDR